MRTLEEVANQLGYHPATRVTAETHDKLRGRFIDLLADVWELVPDGPEKTIMCRKVQEGLMFANLAVAMTAPLDITHASTARVLPNGMEDREVGRS